MCTFHTTHATTLPTTTSEHKIMQNEVTYPQKKAQKWAAFLLQLPDHQYAHM